MAMYASGPNKFYGSPIVFPVPMRVSPSSQSYRNDNNSNYYVIPGYAAVSANDVTGLTISCTSTSYSISQGRIAGGTGPTNGNFYLWEAGHSILLSADL
jgi:hypothetical protein